MVGNNLHMEHLNVMHLIPHMSCAPWDSPLSSCLSFIFLLCTSWEISEINEMSWPFIYMIHSSDLEIMRIASMATGCQWTKFLKPNFAEKAIL